MPAYLCGCTVLLGCLLWCPVLVSVIIMPTDIVNTIHQPSARLSLPWFIFLMNELIEVSSALALWLEALPVDGGVDGCIGIECIHGGFHYIALKLVYSTNHRNKR